MAKEVSGRQQGGQYMIASTGPDVCLTPMGSGMVPVAYCSVAFLDPAVRVSTSVRNNGGRDFQLNSRAATSTGHEPGTGRGVQETGYKGMAHAKTASATVFSEGWAVVRDSDPAWINHPGPGPTEDRRTMTEETCLRRMAQRGTPFVRTG
jgi:hypothetical protein